MQILEVRRLANHCAVRLKWIPLPGELCVLQRFIMGTEIYSRARDLFQERACTAMKAERFRLESQAGRPSLSPKA